MGSLDYLGCQWLLTVLVVRLGSYESAGILSLCMSITNLFYTLASFGIRDFQVSDYNGTYTASAQYVSTRLLTCTASAGLCCAVVGLNRGYTGYEAACIIVYMLYRVAEALVDTFQAMEQKAERMDYNFISFVLRGTLLLVGFSAVLYLTKNLLLAIASIAVTSFAVVLLFDVPIGKKLTGFRMSFSLSATRQLLWECVPLMCNSFLTTAVVSVPRHSGGRLGQLHYGDLFFHRHPGHHCSVRRHVALYPGDHRLYSPLYPSGQERILFLILSDLGGCWPGLLWWSSWR